MITAAVAMCAAVTFAEGLSSQNVVGYAKNELQNGFSAAGAQFVPVAGEKMDLCDIIPVGYSKDSYEGGSIYIQSLDKSGKCVAGSVYYWYDDKDGTAWFDENDQEVVRGKVTYAPGEAIWIKANNAGEGLQTAGQVAVGSIDVMLRAGFKLVCNPTPVAIPFNNDNNNGKFIAAAGYGSDYEGGSIYAQKLDKSGKCVAGSVYYWYDDKDGTAWFDENDDLVEGSNLLPGEAIWIRANSDSEKLNFPAAL